MRRIWLMVRSAATAIVLTMPVWADAPVSGPDRQYAPFLTEATIITDNFTKLHWLRATKNVTFDEATDPKTCVDVSFAGRLPSLKELLTIFDEESHIEYIGTAETMRYVDGPAFGKKSGVVVERTPAGPYWTSSYTDSSNTEVWTVDFSNGKVASRGIGSGAALLRCVEAH